MCDLKQIAVSNFEEDVQHAFRIYYALCGLKNCPTCAPWKLVSLNPPPDLLVSLDPKLLMM